MKTFQMLAADDTETGINLASTEGQRALEEILDGVDLLVLDNLSTLTRQAVRAQVTRGCRCRIGSCGFGAKVLPCC